MKCDGCHKVIDMTANLDRGWICQKCGARLCLDCVDTYRAGSPQCPANECGWDGWCFRMKQEGNFQGRHRRRP